jgi:hypothetical protein
MIIQNVIKNDIFLRCFSSFLGQKSLKKNWKQHISTKLVKGFRSVYELLYLVEKKISTFFLVRVKIDQNFSSTKFHNSLIRAID